MIAKNTKWTPPPDLDQECLLLCIAMNKLPGIETTNSCCGHGDQPQRKPQMGEPHPYWIFFQVKKPEAMLPLLFYIQKCHSPLKGKWHVEAYTDCSGDRVFWMLEGPVGNVAYEDALVIAERLEEIKC